MQDGEDQHEKGDLVFLPPTAFSHQDNMPPPPVMHISGDQNASEVSSLADGFCGGFGAPSLPLVSVPALPPPPEAMQPEGYVLRLDPSMHGSETRESPMSPPLLIAAAKPATDVVLREYPRDPPPNDDSRSRSQPRGLHRNDPPSRNGDKQEGSYVAFSAPSPTLGDLSKEEMAERPMAGEGTIPSIDESIAHKSMGGQDDFEEHKDVAPLEWQSLGADHYEDENIVSVDRQSFGSSAYEDDDEHIKKFEDEDEEEIQYDNAINRNDIDADGVTWGDDNEDERPLNHGIGFKDQEDYSYGRVSIQNNEFNDFPQEEKKKIRTFRKRLGWVGVWIIVVVAIATAIVAPVYFLLLKDEKKNVNGLTRTPFVTDMPTSSPKPTITPQPSQGPKNSTSFTLSPIGTANHTASPTSVPSLQLEPTIPPTLTTSEESKRRGDITKLVISISGVLPFLDEASPQSSAWQWLLNEDPQRLLATDLPQVVQRFTLTSMYFATQGDKWKSCGRPGTNTQCNNLEQRYLSGSSECGWLGVTCDNAGYITSLRLKENGLQGNLLSEIGELDELETLILSRNSLVSTIPTSLGRLSQLRLLLLNRNEFTGKIPTELGTLDRLYYLHLGDNQLDGTLPGAVFIPSLHFFDVGKNMLTGSMPNEMTQVSYDLVNIDIGNNIFTGTIPAGLGSLTDLTFFTGDNNDFSGPLSGNVFNARMGTFDIHKNRISGVLPNDLFNKGRSLTLLNLAANNFEGTIPSGFGDLTNLKQLAFWFNDFVGNVPTTIGLLTDLEILHFAHNKLLGQIPEEVCKLRMENGGVLSILSSDCELPSPEIICDCCTQCYGPN